MKTLILWFIHGYWRLVPESRRRQCLFRESCSNYVFRRTRDQGALAGLSALKIRWHRCRPGYSVVASGDGLALLCTDGSFVDGTHVAPEILSPFEQAHREIELRLSSV